MRKIAAVAVAGFLALSGSAAAQDPGATATADLGVLWTSGNTELMNLSASGKYSLIRPAWAVSFDALALRNEANQLVWYDSALGEDGPREVETLTVAKYAANGAYDLKLTERIAWTSGLGWSKDEMAGIDGFFALRTGVAWTPEMPADSSLKLTLGAAWLRQVYDDPAKSPLNSGLLCLSIPGGCDDDDVDGVGLFAGVDWKMKVREGAVATVTGAWDETLRRDESDDRVDGDPEPPGKISRGFLDAGLTFGLTDILAVKLGVRLDYNRYPARRSLVVVVEDPDFASPSPDPNDFPMYKKLDSAFMVSLVFKWSRPDPKN